MRTEDGHIIRKCLDGKPAAFGFLVDKYKASIYAFAYTELRNLHDAEDVTQEVFIKAYQRLRTLKRYDSFLAWLYSINSSLCKMWLRAQSRRPDREFIEDHNPEIFEETSLDFHRADLAYRPLHEALSSLPKIYRQVLTLRYFGGMNSKEIARFLGTSPNAIRMRLTRARSQLKEGMLAMMHEASEQNRLQASFTFRIVEVVKHIKINPMPRAAGLPWGLSLAMGIIITVLSLNPHLSITSDTAIPTVSPLPDGAQGLEVGEVSVDVLKITNMTTVSDWQGNGKGGELKAPNRQNCQLYFRQVGAVLTSGKTAIWP